MPGSVASETHYIIQVNSRRQGLIVPLDRWEGSQKHNSYFT